VVSVKSNICEQGRPNCSAGSYINRKCQTEVENAKWLAVSAKFVFLRKRGFTNVRQGKEPYWEGRLSTVNLLALTLGKAKYS
jgi:hypothetical protein